MAKSLEVAQLYASIGVKGMDSVSRGLATLQGKFTKLKTMLLASSAASTAGFMKMNKVIIDSGAEFEVYRKRLLMVTKDQEQANKVFKDMVKWAALNPADTDDTIAAYIRLKTAAVKNSEAAIEAVGNLSAVAGTSMSDTANALVMANSRTLVGYGVSLRAAGDDAVIQIGQTSLRVENTIEAKREGILKAAQMEYAGAMDQMKNTWKGNMDTMEGMWGDFVREVAGDAGAGGPFDALKSVFVEIRERWESWMSSPTYGAFIKRVQRAIQSTTISVMRGVASILSALSKLVETVEKYSSTAEYGLIGKLVFGAKGMAIGAAVGLVEDTITGKAEDLKRRAEIEKKYKNETDLLKSYIAEKQAALEAVPKGKWDISSGVAVYKTSEEDKEKREAALEELKEAKVAYESFVEGWLNEINKKESPISSAFSEALNDGSKAMDELIKKYIDTMNTPAGADSEKLPKFHKTRNDFDPDGTMVKSFVQKIKDQIAYTTKTAADFLPELNAMLGNYTKYSEGWKMVKDIILEAHDEIVQKAKAASAEIVERQDWQYSQQLMSADEYLNVLLTRYRDANQSLEGLGPGNLRDEMTAKMRASFEGLQSVAGDSVSRIQEKLSDGTLSTASAQTQVKALIQKYKDAGLQVPADLKKLAASFDPLREATKSWAAEFQNGITSAIVNCESLGDVLSNIGKQIEQFVLNMMLWGSNGDGGLFGGMFSGWINSFFPAHHGGGVIGVDAPSFVRPIHLPKYHSGGVVGRGEELALLKKNETVFTPGQLEALKGMGGGTYAPSISVNVTNNGGGDMDNEQAEKLGRQVNAMVENKIAETMYKYQRSGYFNRYAYAR